MDTGAAPRTRRRRFEAVSVHVRQPMVGPQSGAHPQVGQSRDDGTIRARSASLTS